MSTEEEAMRPIKSGAVRLHVTGESPVSLEPELVGVNLQLDEDGKHTVQINFYGKQGRRIGFVEMPQEDFLRASQSGTNTLESVKRRENSG
ncbi:MAG: hypothetical protein PHU23_15555 [Dehalococcoidales bacterium]|nr:hypothetical protein [Dehalococcoidales bacterium]